jgi:uncharacterized protein YbjT (DUF2867 family)
VERALEGAEGALLVCPLRAGSDDVAGEARQLIDTLAKAIDSMRPRFVVAVSDYGAHVPEGTGITLIFRRLEEVLGSVGVPVTFLRSAEHMQNASRHLEVARERGILQSLHHPVSKHFPAVSALDVGQAAAEILSRPVERAPARRVVHVEGPRRYSASDLSSALSRIVGRQVVAQALPRARWEAALTSRGLGASYARLVGEMQDAHNAGLIDVEPGGEVRLGTTSLAEALAPYRSA